MSTSQPFALSIAGFDPSGGAGILADIKTFEAHQVYGFGVCSALTIQNDVEFENVKWVETSDILDQINILFKRFKIKWAKIGLIENMNTLEEVIDFLRSKNKNIKIIWDPIMKATAGFVFHKNISKNRLFEICKKIFLITPNIPEINSLFPDLKEEAASEALSRYCKVLLKGGHRDNKLTTDIIYKKNSNFETFEAKRIEGNTKHGTGCIHSAAILAGLAKGETLVRSCFNAKLYTEQFLMSNHST